MHGSVEWHLVARVGDISSGSPKLVTVEEKEIGVFYERGKYYAVLNYCPHFRAEVCRGRVTGTLFCDASEKNSENYDLRQDEVVLRCPWHHWEFSLDTGRAVIPSVKQRLKTYDVRIDDDSVYVSV